MTEDMTLTSLKREVKLLQKGYNASDRQAELHVRQWVGDKRDLKLADFLHAIARERGFQSWPNSRSRWRPMGLDLRRRGKNLPARSILGRKSGLALAGSLSGACGGAVRAGLCAL